MILPDGYSDVPSGKIAAVVTHLEMTERPVLPPDPPGVWSLRRVHDPALDWFREIYGVMGEEWLWSSRSRMSDAEVAALIRPPSSEIYALLHDGRDEGVLHLDFGTPGQCELSLCGVTAKLIGSVAGRFLMNRAFERAWSQAIARV